MAERPVGRKNVTSKSEQQESLNINQAGSARCSTTERALTKLAYLGGKMAVTNGKSYFSWVQRRQCIPGSAISNWPLAVSQTKEVRA
jgi:hypothetical protein